MVERAHRRQLAGRLAVTLAASATVVVLVVLVVLIAVLVPTPDDGALRGTAVAPGERARDDDGALIRTPSPGEMASSAGAPSQNATSPPAEAPRDSAGAERTRPPQRVSKAGKRIARRVERLLNNLAAPTAFRVASFNVLGHSHTVPGGNRPGWAPSRVRMAWTVRLLREADVDVVGFQELEIEQYQTFRNLTGGSFELFPGPTLDRGSLRDSIAWRTDTWRLVEARSVGVPYFGGMNIRRPVVKLNNIASGRDVWFFNTHNPADVRGNAARWRAVATDRQVDLARQLGADGTPVVFTGDYNDRGKVFCKFVRRTGLVAANGGDSSKAGCSTPGTMDVDWIFGSGMSFTSFRSVRDGLVAKTSDHPLVIAQGLIPRERLRRP